mgnify:CR=1 FL=1
MDRSGEDHHDDSCCEGCRDIRVRLLAELNDVGRLPEKMRPSIENAVKEFVTQRAQFASRVESGEQVLQVSVDFIDNMLSQLIPTYVPPKGHTCKCHSH